MTESFCALNRLHGSIRHGPDQKNESSSLKLELCSHRPSALDTSNWTTMSRLCALRTRRGWHLRRWFQAFLGSVRGGLEGSRVVWSRLPSPRPHGAHENACPQLIGKLKFLGTRPASTISRRHNLTTGWSCSTVIGHSVNQAAAGSSLKWDKNSARRGRLGITSRNGGQAPAGPVYVHRRGVQNTPYTPVFGVFCTPLGCPCTLALFSCRNVHPPGVRGC